MEGKDCLYLLICILFTALLYTIVTDNNCRTNKCMMVSSSKPRVDKQRCIL